MSESPATTYEADKIQYLSKITQLFGGYKRRTLEFMHLQPGLHVLDAGCGTGDDLIALARQFGPALTLTGVDVLPELVAEAARRAEAAGVSITFTAGDLNALPLGDNTVDRARTDRVFQHLAKPAEALKELMRVTRPGGWVVCADVDWGALVIDHPMQELTDRIAAFYRDRIGNGRAGRSLYRLFRQAGFEEVEVYAEAVCITDWTVARFVWGLDAVLKKITDAGLLTPDETAQWLARGQELAMADRFCGSMTGFVVRGRNPET